MAVNPFISAALAVAMLASPFAAAADGMSPEAEARLDREVAARLAAGGGKSLPGPYELKLVPGQPATIRISRNHMNRIVTPFETFDIWTNSGEEFKTSANVIYIAPGSERPVTLFLTPSGNEAMALSLVLVPEDIPPTEVSLVITDKSGGLVSKASWAPAVPAAPLPAAAAPNFAADPHERAITDLLRDLARGDIPPGFTPGSLTAAHPRCRITGPLTADFSAAQRFVGASYEVFIGIVRSAGGPAVFSEERCAAPDVSAVALWPSAEIPARGEAEIYVVRRRAAPAPAQPLRERPSLLADQTVRKAGYLP